MDTPDEVIAALREEIDEHFSNRCITGMASSGSNMSINFNRKFISIQFEGGINLLFKVDGIYKGDKYNEYSHEHEFSLFTCFNSYVFLIKKWDNLNVHDEKMWEKYIKELKSEIECIVSTLRPVIFNDTRI